MGKDKSRKTIQLEPLEQARMQVCDANILLCRAELEKTKLRFKAEQAEAEVQSLKAQLAANMSSIAYDGTLKAQLATEKTVLDEQRKLASELSERYNIDWTQATYTPETGQVRLDGLEQ